MICLVKITVMPHECHDFSPQRQHGCLFNKTRKKLSKLCITDPLGGHNLHYCDIIMDMMASQITSLIIVYSTVYSDADQRKHQSSASLAFVWGIHQWPVYSLHKWPVTRKMFAFHDVIMGIFFHGMMSSCKFMQGNSRNFIEKTQPFSIYRHRNSHSEDKMVLSLW